MWKRKETWKADAVWSNVLRPMDCFDEFVVMHGRSAPFGWAEMGGRNIVGNRGEDLRGGMA